MNRENSKHLSKPLVITLSEADWAFLGERQGNRSSQDTWVSRTLSKLCKELRERDSERSFLRSRCAEHERNKKQIEQIRKRVYELLSSKTHHPETKGLLEELGRLEQLGLLYKAEERQDQEYKEFLANFEQRRKRLLDDIKRAIRNRKAQE